MPEPVKIKWYRSPIERAALSGLMQCRDGRAAAHVFAQLSLFALTSSLAYASISHAHRGNLVTALPLACLALFIHGTCGSFLGAGGPVHELCHRTPFKGRAWNDFFVGVYAFLSWTNPVAFRASHSRHHQVTVHEELDGEVVLPQRLNMESAWFIFCHLAIDPMRIFNKVRDTGASAFGQIRNPWLRQCLPETNKALRAEHRRWAAIVFFGHLGLAALFVSTGHWWLILIINLGASYSGWLIMLCGMPQHIGMAPDVADFRLCCRTYTCSWFPAFLYWNMQYHVEHHMFPAVPFYNLPRLRAAIAQDLPPATHGLWATWREIIPVIRRQRTDSSYVFVPRLPAGENSLLGAGNLMIDPAAG